jgi:transposase InsO family protein
MTYFGSASTLYRILRNKNALRHRQESKKQISRSKPQLMTVTASNQIWAWDITWLRTDVQGQFKYAYTIIDLYDRVIVGWSIEENESDAHATALFRRVIRDQQVIPQFVHADNGNPMRGVTLASFLDKLLISRSYSRPRVSNDNAFIESWHKTLKYTVGYPKFFTSLEHARAWYADFIQWYNSNHLHSGLSYVTPLQCRTGEADGIYARRNETLREARKKNPSRWRQNKVRIYKLLQVNAPIRLLKIAS